jgi:hypothetical protein
MTFIRECEHHEDFYYCKSWIICLFAVASAKELDKEIPAAHCAKEVVTDKIDVVPSRTLSVRQTEDPVHSAVRAVSEDGSSLCLAKKLKTFVVVSYP